MEDDRQATDATYYLPEERLGPIIVDGNNMPITEVSWDGVKVGVEE
jgi:hypothetical protein